MDPHDGLLEGVTEMLDTSLTPDALRKISRSVMDISSLGAAEAAGISRSTTHLVVDGEEFHGVAFLRVNPQKG